MSINFDKDDCNIVETLQRSIDINTSNYQVKKANTMRTQPFPTNTKHKVGKGGFYNTNIYERVHTNETEKNDVGPQRPALFLKHYHKQSSDSTEIMSLSYVDKGLSTLPPEILEQKYEINSLDFNLNKFEFFPLEIVFFKNLKILRLDHNRIKCLPTDLSHMQSLQILSLSYNLLQLLPSTLSKLSQLQELNLEFNLLSSFGSEITDLKTLRIFNINKNRLTVLPSSFCNMLALNEFYFEWFKYANPPLSPKQKGPEGLAKIQIVRDACKQCRQNKQKGLDFSAFVNLFSTGEVDFHCFDLQQRTLLHYSAIYEDISVMKYVLNLHPDFLNQPDADGQTALTISIIKEKNLASRYLIKHGADLMKGGGPYGSPLHIAVRKLNVALVKDILKAGENPNKPDNDGLTPLHHSIALMVDSNPKAIAITQLLLENNANPNAKNKENWTALHLATRRKDAKTVEWILAYNKDSEEIHGQEKFLINKKGGSYKWTATHLAAYCDVPVALEGLARANCDLFSRSLNGYTPKRLINYPGLSLKLVEKYEQSYIYNKIFNKEVSSKDDLACYNLQNLNKTQMVSNASKNKFEVTTADDDYQQVITCQVDFKGIFPYRKCLSAKKPDLNGSLPQFAAKSRDDDSFEISPEEEKEELNRSEHDDTESARPDFCTELNENVSVKTTSQPINFSDKNAVIKQISHPKSPSKNIFSIGFKFLLNIDISNYEKYLQEEPNFGLEFLEREAKIIRDFFTNENLVLTERMKVFVLLRILHQNILLYITKTLRMSIPYQCYPLLGMTDSTATLFKEDLSLQFTKEDVEIASNLYQIVPQLLRSLYKSLKNGTHDRSFMKSAIITLFEELLIYQSLEFLESIANDASEMLMLKASATKAIIHLRSVYEEMISQLTVQQ